MPAHGWTSSTSSRPSTIGAAVTPVSGSCRRRNSSGGGSEGRRPEFHVALAPPQSSKDLAEEPLNFSRGGLGPLQTDVTRTDGLQALAPLRSGLPREVLPEPALTATVGCAPTRVATESRRASSRRPLQFHPALRAIEHLPFRLALFMSHKRDRLNSQVPRGHMILEATFRSLSHPFPVSDLT